MPTRGLSRRAPLNTLTLLPAAGSGLGHMSLSGSGHGRSAFAGTTFTPGPLRVSIGPFDRGFLSIGFHSRHGVAFYGLTIRSADATALDLVLQPPEFEPPDTSEDAEAEPNRDILVKAPEPEGFLTVQTPVEDGADAGTVADILTQVRCAPDKPKGR